MTCYRLYVNFFETTFPYTAQPTYKEWAINMSSNINEVVRTVLNFFFFFTKRFYKHQKAPKSTKKHQKAPKAPKSTKNHKNHKHVTKQEHKNANKQTKIKNALKSI